MTCTSHRTKNTPERIAALAEKDHVSAGHLSTGLEASSIVPARFQGEATAFDRVQTWLTANPDPFDLVILPGASGPAEIDALIRLMPPSTKLLLLERNLTRAAQLFLEVPFEDYVASGRLILAFGECDDWIDHQLITNLYLPDGPSIGITDFSQLSEPEMLFYNDLLLRIRERIRLKTYHLATLVHLGPTWQFNALKNLPLLVANPGLSDLTNLFTDRPALVVAAGPSLNDAMPIIAELRHHFVIIAVGTALKPLRAAGIRPDIVISVDASKKTGPQFLTPCDDLFLACTSFAFPAILPRFRGLFTGSTSADPVGDWISTVSKPKGAIMSGGTVTASALELAVNMGCSPVISVGLDLCMTDDGTTHASHSMYQGVRCPDAYLVPVPGNYVDKVRTTTQFMTYITAISDYVTNIRPGITFVNANTGGARIDGMQLIRPDEIKRYAGETFDAYETIAQRHSDARPDDGPRFLQAIDEALTDLRETAAEAMSAAMTCNRLIMLLRRPHLCDIKEAEELLEMLNVIDKSMLDRKAASTLLDMSLRPAFYVMGDFNADDSRRKTNGLSAIQRSKVLYEQMAGAAKWTINIIEASRKEIQTSIETADNRNIDVPLALAV